MCVPPCVGLCVYVGVCVSYLNDLKMPQAGSKQNSTQLKQVLKFITLDRHGSIRVIALGEQKTPCLFSGNDSAPMLALRCVCIWLQIFGQMKRTLANKGLTHMRVCVCASEIDTYIERERERQSDRCRLYLYVICLRDF